MMRTELQMQAYQIAYRKAVAALSAGDLAEAARRRGAACRGRRLELPYFGQPVAVEVPEQAEGEARFHPDELPLAEKILILHYLLSTDRQPVRGRQLSFKQLPGASFYEPTYRKRGPERIARRFGGEPETFRLACRTLGWEPAELGDASFAFQVFPQLRGTVVLHGGDEEFPPEANLLFEDRIVNLLPLEDVAVLAGLVATRLGRAAQAPGGPGTRGPAKA
jgi:hypothetical protein